MVINFPYFILMHGYRCLMALLYFHDSLVIHLYVFFPFIWFTGLAGLYRQRK